MKADRNFRRNGSLYTQFDEEEEDAAFGYKAKQESVLDYYDDGEE